MGVRKLTKFWGIAPKLSPELLPDQQFSLGQVAVNAKLYSGDLIPYRAPSAAYNAGRSGELKTIYPLIDPDTGGKKWLSWTTDVDVVVASSINDEEQRIYYTGDGVPKVTNYELAVGSASAPYPNAYYELGLPLPDDKPTATPAALSDIAIANVSRNSENIATFRTATDHGFRTGNSVTVSGFSVLAATASATSSTKKLVVTPVSGNVDFAVGSDVTITVTAANGTGATGGVYTITEATSTTFTVVMESITSNGTPTIQLPMQTFNVKSSVIDVLSDTTFSTYSYGPELDETSGTFATDYGSGIVASLGGTKVGRQYVYTWMTPWYEESIASEPSEIIYVVEGQQVTVGNLPTTAPTGSVNFIRGFRIYRTITSTTGTDFFRMRTVWFPNDIASISRTSNVVTVTMSEHHNLFVDDKIKISGVEIGGSPDTSFDVTDVLVLELIDDYTFTYTAAGSDVAETAVTGGTLYYDITQTGSDASRYYEGTTFVDDYDFSLLSQTMDSQMSAPPDPDMQGLTVGPNNILVGFVGNEVCFSEPGKPWAWPIDYRLVLDSQIVALANVGGRIVVLTEKYPYYIDGNDPAFMSYQRGMEVMPCLSKRGVVELGFGVIFPTYGGLGLYGPQAGQTWVTKLIHDWDTWIDAYDPSTIVAEYYNGKYFASHAAGSFIFEAVDEVGGNFVTLPVTFTTAYHDAITNKFFYTPDSIGNIYEWDADGQPFLPLEWKSKVFIDNAYTSIGAARVVADYGDVSDAQTAILAYNTEVPTYNAGIWTLMPELGTVNGPTTFYTDPDTSATVTVPGGLNDITINGDPLTRNLLSTTGISIVTFKMWANKQLVHSVDIDNSDIFRLPAGYKTDTFEVSVSGAVRIRAIHLGETPTSLGST